MFINKTPSGQNNICGRNVARLRKSKKWSQNRLASMLQICGLNVDKNAVQRIEAGKRFVTDLELVFLADAFGSSVEELLDRKELLQSPPLPSSNP